MDRIKRWLSAPEFAETPHQAQSLREEGTATWILDREKFVRWKHGDWSMKKSASKHTMTENALWIYGMVSNCVCIDTLYTVPLAPVLTLTRKSRLRKDCISVSSSTRVPKPHTRSEARVSTGLLFLFRQW